MRGKRKAVTYIFSYNIRTANQRQDIDSFYTIMRVHVSFYIYQGKLRIKEEKKTHAMNDHMLLHL